MTEAKSKYVTLVCPICEKEFEIVRRNRSKRKYCSRDCSNEAKSIAYKGRTFNFHKLDEEKEKEICRLYVDEEMPTTEIAPLFDVHYSTIIRVIRKHKVERTVKEAAKLRMRVHAETFRKSNAKKIGLHVGENSPRYINGSGKWRDNVLERDQYTCQHCGLVEKEIVRAHHVIPRSVDRTKQYDVDNGITLCPNCHAREHNRLRTLEE